MNRLMVTAAIALVLCPFALAQPEEIPISSSGSKTGPMTQVQPASQLSSVAERTQAIRNARTICIHSETVFLPVNTLERALMKQKNWDLLGLNIVSEQRGADLQINIDRLHFTHIHTYVLTDKKTEIVLAADRIRALDGVVASGPMAARIVKILSDSRLPTQP